MNEHLAREQRRNLRKAIGETATAAMGETRQLVAATSLAQQALARELQAMQAAHNDTVQRLHARIDGASAWAQQNEDAIAVERRAREVFERMTFRQRLRWIVRGQDE